MCKWTLLLAAVASVSCRKTAVSAVETSENSGIAFYVKTGMTRASVDNTETLETLKLPLYVTDASENSPVFSDGTEILYRANGVWASSAEWNVSKDDYSFYGYVFSPGNGSVTGAGSGNNGSNITLSQPENYSTDNSVWADFLMSYRVGADGAERPMVRLELERVTTGVELYMSKSPAMSSVVLERVEFRNIAREARFSLVSHATSETEPGYNGMKNVWSIVPTGSVTNYEYEPGMELQTYDPAAGAPEERFSDIYRIMSFLTVQQEAIGRELYIRYKVDENGSPSVYETVIPLGDFEPRNWYRGHKIRYYVSVDSSVELIGSIASWGEPESIEGTLLPD